MRMACAVLGLLVAAVSIGCSPVNIKCKVIEGELSTMAIARPNDARLEGEGIVDAEITVIQMGPGGTEVVRTTNDSGRASIPLEGTGALSSPIAMSVRAPGYLPAVIEQMPIPTSDQQVLILLEPIRSNEP